MSAAVAAALKKIAAFILSDKELRGKLFVIIGSIVCGLLGLLCLPVVAIVSLGNMEIEPPEIDKSMFNEAAFIQNLSSNQQAQLANLQNQGQAIEDAMTAAEVRNQTIKAQLIYLSFFDGVQNFNAQSYVDLFKNSTDDKALIDALNSTYGLKIDYSEFMKSYTWVMNATINQYMFADSKSKNAADLAAWADNAYISGWGYKDGTFGDVLTEGLLQDRAAVFGSEVTDYMDFIRQNWMGKRCADCVGLIKGYGWYDSASGEIRVGTNGMMDVGANAMFANATVKGTIDTIPEVPGLAVWVDGHIGIYIGNGEVIEAMNTLRGVTRTQLAGREWTHWLQIPYISYVEKK